MPTFDGNSGKLELFEYLCRASLKIHNQLSEDDKIKYFHSLVEGNALQTFKNIYSLTRNNLIEILAKFWRRYVKPQSMAMAKHKSKEVVFNPANRKLDCYFDERRKLVKDAFGKAALGIIQHLIYAKMQPHLKKSINQAHLGNGTYD